MGKMKHAATQELYSYWNRLRGDRMAPERADIDPGAIRGVLADTFILDVVDLENMRFRIAGARINALFVNELKDMDFLTIWAPQSRTAVRELAANTSRAPTPAIAGVHAAPPGRPALDLELLLLPLRHVGRPQSRLLGGLSPAAVPLWLGLVPVTGLELGSMRIIRTGQASSAESFARTAADARSLPVRHGHLRVLNGGNSTLTSGLDQTR